MNALTLPAAFTESLRYDGYDLSPSDLVVDCGGYEGAFARAIAARYGCRVVIFEPVREFFQTCWCMASSTGIPFKHLVTNIEVLNAGVGAYERTEQFGIQGALTGIYNEGANGTEQVRIIRLADWIGDQHVALLKLNIEGMEYEVIADLLATGRIQQVRNLQVQFHRRRDSDDQLLATLHHALARTHDLTFDFPWCWCNWQLRNL